MPMTIGWDEIALRLALTVLAGALLGLNRTERGMTVGLRTTLLVSLAAAVSMIQVNLLLVTGGRTADSFSTLDLMRLPLGVLTGMGFIGGGAILRQGGRVNGVTTAATLWLATILGLCFGGGQHGLGLAALGLGAVILWVVKRAEAALSQERRGILALRLEADGPDEEEIRAVLEGAGCRVSGWDVTLGRGQTQKVRCEVHWSGRADAPPMPAAIRQITNRPGVRAARWKA